MQKGSQRIIDLIDPLGVLRVETAEKELKCYRSSSVNAITAFEENSGLWACVQMCISKAYVLASFFAGGKPSTTYYI